MMCPLIFASKILVLVGQNFGSLKLIGFSRSAGDSMIEGDKSPLYAVPFGSSLQSAHVIVSLDRIHQTRKFYSNTTEEFK